MHPLLCSLKRFMHYRFEAPRQNGNGFLHGGSLWRPGSYGEQRQRRVVAEAGSSVWLSSTGIGGAVAGKGLRLCRCPHAPGLRGGVLYVPAKFECFKGKF